MRILVLGASGMLGHMVFAELLRRGLDVYGAARRPFPCRPDWATRLQFGMDAMEMETVKATIDRIRPDVLINAVGLVRQIPEGRQPVPCLMVNALFPWRLLEHCDAHGARLIHYSTDCVFDGRKGDFYTEEDPSTAEDFYGRTKSLGEVNAKNGLTIRTSIIGPELRGKHSLLEWFLGAAGPVNGYTDAIYSGLPTSEQARVLYEYVLPNPDLNGLYQAVSAPVSKFELLQMLATAYGLNTTITPCPGKGEDKRLSGNAFRGATGYEAPPWPEMLAAMHRAHQENMKDFS